MMLVLGAGRHEVQDIPDGIRWYRSAVAFGPLYYSDFPDSSDSLAPSDLAFSTLLGA